jgi:hypothetical protein
VDAEVLTGPHAKAANSFEKPDTIQSGVFSEVRLVAGCADFELPALSIAALTFQLA